jgi:hypothetical protein
MVTPTRNTKNPSSGGDAWLVFFIKALLVAVIILMLPKLVDGKSSGSKRRRKVEKQLTALRQSCVQECNNEIMVFEESMNRVHLCISEQCFNQFYKENPLEDGEIDVLRIKEFEKCAKEELRLERIRQRSEARENKRQTYNRP